MSRRRRDSVGKHVNTKGRKTDLAGLTKLARDKVGPRTKFKSNADYLAALARERQRLRNKFTNKELIEAVEKRISNAPGPAPEYRKEFANVARIVCSVYGSTVEELGKFFRVTPDQIQFWIRDYPEFEQAVRDRSTEINMQIMGRLARRAMGFHVNTEKIFYDVKRGHAVRVATKEYYPPSEAAIMFWLKNRMTEFWKDQKDVNIDETRKLTLEIYKNFDNMNPEQASDAYQELLKLQAPVASTELKGKPGRKPKEITDVPVVERGPHDS